MLSKNAMSDTYLIVNTFLTHKFRFVCVNIYISFEYFNIRRFFPTLVIVSVRFLILCNNDFGVIVKIVINENGNYFFVAQKQPP